jgi:hypothetical protein
MSRQQFLAAFLSTSLGFSLTEHTLGVVEHLVGFYLAYFFTTVRQIQN